MFRHSLRILALLFGLTVAVVLIVLHTTNDIRNATRRTRCKGNLKQILLAMYNYREAHGGFPPAYTTDSTGRTLHSWRTLLLPHMDMHELYESIDLSKPWDDPANEQARKSSIEVYHCPSIDLRSMKPKESGRLTTYFAVVTQDSCLRPTELRNPQDITDGTSNTMVIFEASPERAVHWMEPSDVDEQMVLAAGKSATPPHIGGFHAGLADGTVRFLSVTTDKQTLRALITISADDKVGEF